MYKFVIFTTGPEAKIESLTFRGKKNVRSWARSRLTAAASGKLDDFLEHEHLRPGMTAELGAGVVPDISNVHIVCVKTSS